MALNIGQINFGVDANTAGLQKAIAQLNRFQKKTDEIAKSSVKGAQATSNAYARQESAIKKSFQATLALQQQLRKAGVPPEQIAKVSQAFKKLTTDMTSGKLTVVQFNRAMDAFSAKLGRSRRALKETNEEVKKGKTGLAKYSVILRDLESSAVLALGPLSGLGARIRSIGAIIGRGTGGISGKLLFLIGTVTAATIAFGLLGSAALKAGDRMRSLLLRFEAASGSLAQGKAEYKFTIDLARKLGLQVDVLAKSYSRFLAASQGTAIEGQKTQQIFTQIARSAAALKLSGEDVEGVMRALEQIMSKGTVQAEELRGQLGDRLPGAFRIAAEAMSMTTQELNRQLKAGKIMSDDFLPKFAAAYEAAVGKNAEKNLTTLSGAWSNLGTDMSIALGNISEGLHLQEIAVSLINAIPRPLSETSSLLKETSEEMAANAERMAKTAEPVIVLTNSYTELSAEIEKASAALLVQQEAIGFLGRAGNDIDFLLDFFKALPGAMDASQDDLNQLAEDLSRITGLNFPATAEGIAAGMAEFAAQTREANDEVARLKAAPGILADLNKQLDFMSRQNVALGLGPEAAKAFDLTATATATWEEALKKTNLSLEDQEMVLEQLIAALILKDSLEKKNVETLRAAAEAEAKLAREQLAREKGLAKAGEAIDTLRMKVAAMAKGPESLEIFDKVQAPLEKFKQELINSGVAGQELINKTREYKELLEEQFTLTDKWARANEAAAAAIVNGLEDVIIKGGGVTEMLNQLAKELLRVAIRALFLDNLQSALSGFFGGGGFGAPLKPGTAAIGAGGSSGMSGNSIFGSRGGDFKVGGSGGGDTKAMNINAKAGEIISIRRPDQMAGRGGGGVNVVQNNSFTSSGDPSTLIPILEENNRQLKGEILDGLDRGTFG